MAYNHTSGKCQRCPVGRYSDGEEETDGCRLCERGTYAASEGQERCVACSSAAETSRRALEGASLEVIAIGIAPSDFTLSSVVSSII
jgi:hypothetical protein